VAGADEAAEADIEFPSDIEALSEAAEHAFSAAQLPEQQHEQPHLGLFGAQAIAPPAGAPPATDESAP
jgi:hypothetical protein